MNVALYLRVSTEDQAENGVSLDMQRDRLGAYCVARGWDVVVVYSDEGSGKNLDRPKLQNMLGLASQRQFGAVVVYKLDRLTRSVRDLGDLLERFERWGVSLVSMTESLDATTATGRLLVNIIGSVAQWEREQTGERTKAAMQHRKKNGLFNGGEPPYGFASSGSRLILKPHELRVVQDVFALRSKGLGPTRIAHDLQYGPRRGGAWHHEQIRRILADVTRYRGLVVEGRPVVV